MKLKSMLVALVALVFALAATAAAAAPGKGKPPRTGEGCKPRVQLVLKGTLGSTSADSLTMTVLRANKHGRRFVGAEPVQVSADAKTKVRRQGKATLGNLVAGDRLRVHARACKADLRAEGAPALLARHVKAWPPKPPAAAPEEEPGEGETTPPPPPAP